MIASVRRCWSTGARVVSLLALSASWVHASGFAIDNQGTRAMGFAGAYVAQASDPSAIFYNAAGVAFLKGNQIYLSGGLGSYATSFTGEGPNPPAGTREESDRLLTVLPSFYYTHQVSSNLVLGLGFNAPFGTRSQWKNPDEFTGRYICTDCEIRSWGLNPTLAYKLEDRLAVGIGLDLRFSSFRLEQRVLASPNPFPVPTDVASLSVESATDTGIGFNVGLLASPSESVTLGLAYRHKIEASYDATADFTQILTGDTVVDKAVALGLPSRQAVKVAHAFPSSFTAGLAVHHGYWTIEGDLAWTFWSSFDRISLSYPDTPALSVSLPEDYESTWQGRIGAEYLLTDTWSLRGGYSYDHGPQPTSTVSPFLHDSNRHGFGLGGSWKHGQVRVDLLARYLYFVSRSTDGLNRYDYNGHYDTTSFHFGIALGYRF
jgi:long-chain fatty acid transport protein